MSTESYCTLIYVYRRSTVTIDAGAAVALVNNDLSLVRFDDARTKQSIPRGRSTSVTLDPGIYKLRTGAEPSVAGGNLDYVIRPDKDPPPDPTLNAEFRSAFPDMTHQKVKEFVREDSKSFDLGGASAKAGSQ